MTRHHTVATACLFAVLAGCGSSPPASFYTLRSDAPPQSSTTTASYSVVVGPLTVPDLIDRPQLVLSNAGNQVTVAEQVRWAAPLRTEIPRVIAGNLAYTLREARVSAYPQSADANADFLVSVDIIRFDSTLGDAATLEALWTVRARKGAPEKNGRAVLHEKTRGAGYAELVAAHQRALSALSLEIAEAIRPINAVSR